MDGNWNKWYLVPLYLLGMLILLPRLAWNKLKVIFRKRKATPPLSRCDDLSWTIEEEEEWQRMEKRQ